MRWPAKLAEFWSEESRAFDFEDRILARERLESVIERVADPQAVASVTRRTLTPGSDDQNGKGSGSSRPPAA